MKNILTLLAGITVLAATVSSCTKDENKIMFEGGTAPVLAASSTNAMVLNIANKNNPAISFNWTNPNYQFTTGLSSQDVTYTLQFDTTGANFTNPKMGSRVISKDLNFSLTVGELNQLMADMDLLENIPHDMEIRVKSALANGSVPLYSNVLKIKITNYLDVKFPVPAELFITGAATPGNWMAGGNPPLLSQKFTKISAFEFQLNSLAINGDQSYLFVPVYGDWSNKYGYTGGGNTNNPTEDEFKPNGNDLKAPAVSGNYRINVNFKTGKYKFTKL